MMLDNSQIVHTKKMSLDFDEFIKQKFNYDDTIQKNKVRLVFKDIRNNQGLTTMKSLPQWTLNILRDLIAFATRKGWSIH